MSTPQPSTSPPTNPSEWQLYYVLQRANLLQYYDTFVAQGGDDVPQLCEAGEEEFLEIMALVGMASKPLHVRRLQKALQEWVANPALFQGNGAALMREPPTHVLSLIGDTSTSMTNSSSSPAPWAAQSPPPPSSSQTQQSTSPVNMLTLTTTTDMSPELVQDLGKPGSCNTHIELKSQSPGPLPVLCEEQIHEISQSASRIVKTLPDFEPKFLSQKKDINKQIYELINLPVEFTKERLELMRKYAAIYRRFDSDRSYSKPMTLHEICVNEAAAQLCYRMPSLLTRREDLFPLSRQVVKGSGYQYSKGHSRSSDYNPENPSKRQRLDVLGQEVRSCSPYSNSSDRDSRQERLLLITKELFAVSEQQELIVRELETAKEGAEQVTVVKLQSHLEQITNKHLQLLTEQSELLQKQSMEAYIDADTGSDKEDSNTTTSESSSPAPADNQHGPSSQPHNMLKAMLMAGQVPKSSLNNLSLLTSGTFTTAAMKNSLFDEGLRIAQQYGLGDFELELKTLQSGPSQKGGNNGEHNPSCVPLKDHSISRGENRFGEDNLKSRVPLKDPLNRAENQFGDECLKSRVPLKDQAVIEPSGKVVLKTDDVVYCVTENGDLNNDRYGHCETSTDKCTQKSSSARIIQQTNADS